MSDMYRYQMITTIAIWCALAAIMIASPILQNLALSIMLLVAAAGSTKFVWDHHEDAWTPGRRDRMGKAKRSGHDRVARLVQTLDEDERADLLARLSAEQDGELVDIDTLLNQQR